MQILRLILTQLVDPWLLMDGSMNYLMSILCNVLGRIALQSTFILLRPQFSQFRKMGLICQ